MRPGTSDGLELINDAMCKARRDFLGSQFRRGMLFDLTPEVELPDLTKLRSSLLALIPQDVRLTRKALRLKGLVKYFGEYNRNQGLQCCDRRTAQGGQAPQQHR